MLTIKAVIEKISGRSYLIKEMMDNKRVSGAGTKTNRKYTAIIPSPHESELDHFTA
jgi:hypothetical protein